MHLRRAEDDDRLENMRIADQHNRRRREAAKALADRDAAVAEMKETRITIRELENICACRHAIESFTPTALGEGKANAGGPKDKQNRFEVLGRLAGKIIGRGSRTRGTRRWSHSMAPSMGRFLQSGCNRCWKTSVVINAFSKFVYDETCRVFHNTAALQVPGG